MQTLIAGIDPGTTTAYALIDLEGNLIRLRSSKQLDFNSLLSEVSKQGNIAVVATDKNPAPSFVEKLAKRIGARLVVPEENLLHREKLELTKEHNTQNRHKRDALATAFFAYKELRPLITKINVHMNRENKEDILDDVADLVLSKKISIRKAADLVS